MTWRSVHGDTDNTPMGWGTYGSRTTAVGAGALLLGLNKIKDKARALAAHLLEAAEADIEYADGQFYVRGAPDQSKSIQEIALMANVAWNMPEGMEPGLEASAFYDPPNFVYPFGAHVAVVDVDTDNGHVVLRRYVAVDDCGPQINPMIVEGQVHAAWCRAPGRRCGKARSMTTAGSCSPGRCRTTHCPRPTWSRTSRRCRRRRRRLTTRWGSRASARQVPSPRR